MSEYICHCGHPGLGCRCTFPITDEAPPPHNCGGSNCDGLVCPRPKPDMVNHPPHYSAQPGIPFECIEITRNMTFCAGNAVKYLWRSDFKNGRQDIEKAQWYLDDALRHADPIFLRMDLYVEREVERKLDVVAQAQTNPHRQWFFIAIRDRHLEAAIECVRNLLIT